MLPTTTVPKGHASFLAPLAYGSLTVLHVVRQMPWTLEEALELKEWTGPGEED